MQGGRAIPGCALVLPSVPTPETAMSRFPRPALVLLATLPLIAGLAGCGDRDSKSEADAAAAATADAATASDAGTPPATAPEAPAAVEPRGAVDEVMKSFLAARSYHVVMDTQSDRGPMQIEMDFVAPDRYRMVTPMGTQYIIGDTMYMSAQGHTMKVPMNPGQTAQFRSSSRFAEHRDTMTVEDQGSETINGQAAHKYLVRNTQPEPSESTMWVGSDGLPMQVEVVGKGPNMASKTTIHYSRFNDPTITIEPPK